MYKKEPSIMIVRLTGVRSPFFHHPIFFMPQYGHYSYPTVKAVGAVGYNGDNPDSPSLEGKREGNINFTLSIKKKKRIHNKLRD